MDDLQNLCRACRHMWLWNDVHVFDFNSKMYRYAMTSTIIIQAFAVLFVLNDLVLDSMRILMESS